MVEPFNEQRSPRGWRVTRIAPTRVEPGVVRRIVTRRAIIVTQGCERHDFVSLLVHLCMALFARNLGVCSH